MSKFVIAIDGQRNGKPVESKKWYISAGSGLSRTIEYALIFDSPKECDSWLIAFKEEFHPRIEKISDTPKDELSFIDLEASLALLRRENMFLRRALMGYYADGGDECPYPLHNSATCTNECKRLRDSIKPIPNFMGNPVV